MAGRFAAQKLAASMSSRSRTLLRAHGGASSASAGVGAPSARRTLSHLLHGPSATQPAGSSSAPNKLGIHGGRGAYDSARGPNRAFSSSSVSSSTSTAGQEIGAGGTVPAWQAEWQAEWDAQDARTRIAASAADFDKFMSNLRLLSGFACASFAVGLLAEELTLRIRKNKGQSVPPSGCCSGCSRPLPAAAAGDMAAHKAKAV